MDAELQAILKRNFNMSDSYRELVTEEILAWHQQEIAKARIDELQQLEEDAWGVQHVPKPRKYRDGYTIGVKSIDERIAELSQTLKEGKPS